MSAETGNIRPELGPAGDESRGATALGWLGALFGRLGLVGQQTLRDTLEEALRGRDTGDGAFTEQEREMLLRLLRFGAKRVDDLMVPRADIIAVEENEPLIEIIRTFEEAGVSRIPVFHETLDDPRGMVHIKDLFRWLAAQAAGRQLIEPHAPRPATPPAPSRGSETDVATGIDAKNPDLTRLDLTKPIVAAKIKRPVLYVPPSMPAMNLLIRMQTTRNHMALVVDEYGGTDGLVTIEDLVEQIVGEIEDEHDEAEDAHIFNDPRLGLFASGRTPVRELEERLGVKLLTPDNEEDIETLAGLVFSIVGRVPARGELVRHPSGIEFEVIDADPRRVKKLKVHVRQEEREPDAGAPDGQTLDKT